MTKAQFDIVNIFLNMNNTPKEIAKSFKADVTDITLVSTCHNYEQYQEKKNGNGRNFFEEMMGGMSL